MPNRPSLGRFRFHEFSCGSLKQIVVIVVVVFVVVVVVMVVVVVVVVVVVFGRAAFGVTKHKFYVLGGALI